MLLPRPGEENPGIITPQWAEVDAYLLKARMGEDADEVIVGNPTDPSKFQPRIELTRWNKENSLVIRLDGYLDAAPVVAENRIDSKNGADKDQGFYVDVSIADQLKFGLVLYAKPITNSWAFKIEGWEEFDFFPQPALKNLNPDGSTWELDRHGFMRYRPANVNGSYAIYHKHKCNHVLGQTNYRNGKFGHFYRIRFIDSAGKWGWADLNISSGVYTVTVPQDFLDKAIYPVIANDTFGYAAGSSTNTFDNTLYPLANVFAAARSPSTGGTITQFSFKGRATSGTVTISMAAYTLNVALPVSRLAAGVSITLTTTPDWRNSSAVSQTMVNGTTYCAAFGNASGNGTLYYDDGSAGDMSEHGGSGALPATWAQSATAAYKFGAYATFTPAGTLRQLIANIVGASATPSVLSTIARALAGNVPAQSATPAAAATVSRSIAANIPAASTTPEITAIIQNIISLIADVAGESITPAIVSTLNRALVSAIAGQSLTSEAAAMTARSLLAVPAGQSNTPSIDATVARAILASIQAASLTPDAAVDLTRSILADIPAGSSTPAIDRTLARELTAAIPAASLTPAISVIVIRSVLADIAGQSSTSEITATIQGVINLIADIAASSVTPEAAHSTARSILGNIQAESSTADILAETARSLLGDIAAQSATSEITGVLATLISLAAAIVGVSLTPGIALEMARTLSAVIPGQSMTPAIGVNISRGLAASCAAESATPEIQAAVARILLADIRGTSLTPDDLLLVLASLGIILDPTIEIITARRTFMHITPERDYESATPKRTIHNA